VKVLRPRASRSAVVAALAAAVALAPSPAGATIVLDPVASVSSPLAWTVGNALARSQGFLHAAWASDCPPPSGACATDTGPYMGVFWQRATIEASPAWSSPRRISQSGQHASRPALAASGGDVYVAWVTRRSYLHAKPTSARVLWVRASPDEGDSWGRPVRVSAHGGRVDFPVIAASGARAWLAWTNADTGAIRMATSEDHGGTWSTASIGVTTAGASSRAGFRGFPSVGASGMDALVAWVGDDAGRIVALGSNVAGTDWSAGSVPTELLVSGPHGGNDYPATRGADDGASTNVAVAYATRHGVQARLFDGGAIGPARDVVGPWPVTVAGRRYDDGYGPAVAPFGAQGVAVAWAACRHRRPALRDPCAAGSLDARIDVLERESTDAGSTWSAFARVALARRRAGIDEAPSLEADAGGDRWFVWLHRDGRWATYQVQGRSGTAG
jgi:hypothetical protein